MGGAGFDKRVQNSVLETYYQCIIRHTVRRLQGVGYREVEFRGQAYKFGSRGM